MKRVFNKIYTDALTSPMYDRLSALTKQQAIYYCVMYPKHLDCSVSDYYRHDAYHHCNVCDTKCMLWHFNGVFALTYYICNTCKRHIEEWLNTLHKLYYFFMLGISDNLSTITALPDDVIYEILKHI